MQRFVFVCYDVQLRYRSPAKPLQEGRFFFRSILSYDEMGDKLLGFL
jgi:hypothetical protein